MVIDIGAGCGTEVVELSRLVGESGLVMAVEAHPASFERLLATIRLSGLHNCIALNIAVSDRRGLVEMSHNVERDMEGIGASIATARDGAEVNRIRVPSVRLGELIRFVGNRNIDYLKMNIEGMEGPVMSESVADHFHIQNWCISCHDFLDTGDTATWDSVRESLSMSGFRRYSRTDRDPLSVERYYVYGKRPVEGHG